MKQVIMTLAMLLAGLTAGAQGEIKDGVWEDKRVVEVEGASASALYMRALEALSDWAGSQGKSKLGIDMQDKDEGIVVYKGEHYIGYGKYNLLAGWETFANFTLKIRCKDGRAQVTATVPSMTFRYTASTVEHTIPIDELLPEYNPRKTRYAIKQAVKELPPKVPGIFEAVIDAMCKRLHNGTEDDDF